jgi:hypothetical protein
MPSGAGATLPILREEMSFSRERADDHMIDKPSCLACGAELSPTLARSGSLRCHDCRDASAPLRNELVEPKRPRLRHVRLRRAA